jgi:hypothetical protein
VIRKSLLGGFGASASGSAAVGVPVRTAFIDNGPILKEGEFIGKAITVEPRRFVGYMAKSLPASNVSTF